MILTTNAREAIADLAIAAADYESAWRAAYGNPSDEAVPFGDDALDARYRALLAFDRLADEVGPDLAKFIRTTLIFTATRVTGTRSEATQSSPEYTRGALRTYDQYSI